MVDPIWSPAVSWVGKLARRTEQKQRKHCPTTHHDPTKRPVRLETRVAARLRGRPTCVRECSSAWLERQCESDRDRGKNDDDGCCPDEATIHDRANLSVVSFAARDVTTLSAAGRSSLSSLRISLSDSCH
jgi:hypothetical protein